MDDCSILPETQLVGKRLHVDTSQALSVGGFLSPMEAAGERPVFDIKPPLGTPLLVFSLGYLLKSFPQGILPHGSGGLESEFSLS